MESSTPSRRDAPRVAIFAPHPLLTVAIESRGGQDDVHTHVGGQGVWVARMAGELGARPIVCSFAGGETGAVIEHLLAGLPGELRLWRNDSRSSAQVLIVTSKVAGPRRRAVPARRRAVPTRTSRR